jgi:hypothetical protein
VNTMGTILTNMLGKASSPPLNDSVDKVWLQSFYFYFFKLQKFVLILILSAS